MTLCAGVDSLGLSSAALFVRRCGTGSVSGLSQSRVGPSEAGGYASIACQVESPLNCNFSPHLVIFEVLAKQLVWAEGSRLLKCRTRGSSGPKKQTDSKG